jgi:DNA-binding transcriptional ArsR family regulator
MRIQHDWVRLPTNWIMMQGLRNFTWGGSMGSSHTAALLTLIAIAHRSDQQTGLSRITYDLLSEATGLSRTKVANGLDVLEEQQLVERSANGRGTYRLAGFDLKGVWAKLPARKHYQGDRIRAFKDFTLRKITELDALKAYLLFVAYRNRESNKTFMTYTQIHEKSGIPTNRIKAAQSLLVVNDLVVVDQYVRPDAHGVSQAYRISKLDPYVHPGTKGRAELEAASPDFDY